MHHSLKKILFVTPYIIYVIIYQNLKVKIPNKIRFYLFIQYLKRCTLLTEISILPSGALYNKPIHQNIIYKMHMFKEVDISWLHQSSSCSWLTLKIAHSFENYFLNYDRRLFF